MLVQQRSETRKLSFLCVLLWYYDDMLFQQRSETRKLSFCAIMVLWWYAGSAEIRNQKAQFMGYYGIMMLCWSSRDQKPESSVYVLLWCYVVMLCQQRTETRKHSLICWFTHWQICHLPSIMDITRKRGWGVFCFLLLNKKAPIMFLTLRRSCWVLRAGSAWLYPVWCARSCGSTTG